MNVLKSLRLQANLSSLLNSMQGKKESNLKEWKVNEIRKLCNFFVKNKFCSEYKNELEQYKEFFDKVCYLNSNRENLIRDMITKAPGLRTYLQIHSAPFSNNPNEEEDWFVKLMRDILRITKEDVDSARQAEFVPQDILKKLEMFDPEPEGFEKENIRIEYDFWGFGGPIRIIDTMWEGIGKEAVDVKEFLSQYDHIEPEIKPPNSYTKEESDRLYEDDGLPF
jgi:hypothetical protein